MDSSKILLNTHHYSYRPLEPYFSTLSHKFTFSQSHELCESSCCLQLSRAALQKSRFALQALILNVFPTNVFGEMQSVVRRVRRETKTGRRKARGAGRWSQLIYIKDASEKSFHIMYIYIYFWLDIHTVSTQFTTKIEIYTYVDIYACVLCVRTRFMYVKHLLDMI